MDKAAFFDALWDLVKETDPPIDFTEVFIGDEEANQIYVLFDNVKNTDGGL